MLPQLLGLAFAGATAVAGTSTEPNPAHSRSQLLSQRMAEKFDLRRGDTSFTKRYTEVEDDPYHDDFEEPEDGDYESVDHELEQEYYASSEPKLFTTQDQRCLLQPEADVGPYYVENSEIEPYPESGTGGVDLGLKIQIYDVNTCNVLEDVFVDMWYANPYGVYSGLGPDASGNGTDTTTMQFGRGMIDTDSEGVVSFGIVFPGRVPGRTRHISFMVRTLDNGKGPNDIEEYTLEKTPSTVIHIGELYFDQYLIDEIDYLPPYSDSNQTKVSNEDDNMMKLMQGPNAPDPVLRYWVEDGDLDNGVTAWIAIGVNTSAKYEPFAAARWHEDESDMSGTATLNTGTSYQTPSYLTASAEIPTVTSAMSTRYINRPSTSDDEYTADSSRTNSSTSAMPSASVEESSQSGQVSVTGQSGGASYGAAESGSGSGSGSSSGSSSTLGVSATEPGSGSGASSQAASETASSLANGQSLLIPSLGFIVPALINLF